MALVKRKDMFAGKGLLKYLCKSDLLNRSLEIRASNTIYTSAESVI